MAEFLSPFWEFLFDAFGVFGIGIAMGIVTFAVIILIVLVRVVWALLKKITKPSRKTYRPESKSVTPRPTSTQPSRPKPQPAQEPKSEAPVKKASTYQPSSLQDYLERAKNGEAFAQCCCGSMYEESKDMDNAIYWFKKAGDQGHCLSNYRLGMIYLEGRGNTEVNLCLAEEYLTYAAEGEFDSAQYQLAMLYSKKNEILCKEMGYTAWEQKKADARYNENYDKYKYWLKKAAANGNIDAEYILY